MTRFDPIPADTLLNLGFDGSDSMAQDWFELCENPDPAEKHTVSPSATATSQGEDEEEVWRRLVSKFAYPITHCEVTALGCRTDIVPRCSAWPFYVICSGAF